MDYKTYEVRVYANGDKFWYQNDRLHRLDGPAVEHADGYKVWYQNGKRHRLDGPAIERVNYKDYWINGEHYTYDDWKKKVDEINNPVKEMTLSQVIEKLGFEVKIVKESK